MEEDIIEILIDASGLADAEGEVQGLGASGEEAAVALNRLVATSDAGAASLSNFATAAGTASKASTESKESGGTKEAADKTASSLAKSASSALSSALKSVVIDGTSFSEAASTLSSRLASSALTSVSSKMFDTLLSNAMNSFSSSSGWLSSLFANGGVMTSAGPVELRAYAGGGVADSPQLALFGEGSMNEAYVPLPDGRSIPVTMSGGASAPSVNIQMTVAAQDAASFRRSEGQIGATVAAKLQRHMQRYG